MDSRSVVSRLLAPREQILWLGQPDPRRRFVPADAYLVPFSIFWLAFSLFWLVGALASVLASPELDPFVVFFPLFGIPFVAIGIYMAVGRFVVKARRRRRTHYALTNLRLLAIESRGGGPVVQAMYLDQVPAVSTRLRSDGSGTLTFGQPLGGMTAMYEDTGMEFFMGGVTAPLSFRDVPDAAHVAELADRARLEARNASGPSR